MVTGYLVSIAGTARGTPFVRTRSTCALCVPGKELMCNTHTCCHLAPFYCGDHCTFEVYQKKKKKAFYLIMPSKLFISEWALWHLLQLCSYGKVSLLAGFFLSFLNCYCKDKDHVCFPQFLFVCFESRNK